ncbi:flagellar hook-basal body complex protein [Legionella hackeliae]|uniref:Flagellar hook protein FlgE n=1 Tax=Legionella hackeliae TaxID=449 RepID=A0A0A8UXR6_LEGHA|nr:flagellar hook-basal body complex protein [Legionella hackeliae]KTD13150.1 flagellar hook protein FlgE [Legionella hackeliae]CEK11539.1 Flagellar hook protein FlgE [Legionella hackeliae]STX48310.1 flagellar hook protein FlgE [Legionella hackeliae]
MTIRFILIAAVLFVSPQLYPSNFLKLTKEPLIINRCPILSTGNPLDLALLNNGYFVVSGGKKGSELLFTRFGMMLLDKNYNVRDNDGNYLLAVTKKSDAKHLSKIKIPQKNLAPKATTRIAININLPAAAIEGSNYESTTTLYDSLGNIHEAKINSEKISMGHWKVEALIDGVKRDTGILVFKASGELSQQEGLHHIQWPAEYGMHELKIDFKSSTQFASPFFINYIKNDGYPLGILDGMDVLKDGQISLMYSNGILKLLKNRIAVAMFTNPSYLERVTSRLYRPSEKSGEPRIHWVNGENAVFSGGIEEENCLVD